jgi:hypothetical protein
VLYEGWPPVDPDAHRLPREVALMPDAEIDALQAQPSWPARVVVLEGQQHLADILAPELVAAHLVAFLRERR